MMEPERIKEIEAIAVAKIGRSENHYKVVCKKCGAGIHEPFSCEEWGCKLTHTDPWPLILSLIVEREERGKEIERLEGEKVDLKHELMHSEFETQKQRHLKSECLQAKVRQKQRRNDAEACADEMRDLVDFSAAPDKELLRFVRLARDLTVSPLNDGEKRIHTRAVAICKMVGRLDLADGFSAVESKLEVRKALGNTDEKEDEMNTIEAKLTLENERLKDRIYIAESYLTEKGLTLPEGIEGSRLRQTEVERDGLKAKLEAVEKELDNVDDGTAQIPSLSQEEKERAAQQDQGRWMVSAALRKILDAGKGVVPVDDPSWGRVGRVE